MKKEFKSQKIKAVIKELLKKKGITYEDLARQLECSVPTIKRILGREELTLNRLLELCEVVDVDLGELEMLIKKDEKESEEFTDEQQVFLAKNKSFFAYFMKLMGGQSPKQIAEENNLTSRSTEKYLIGLERQQLIRVTGKQKVKPAFKGVPSFGTGPLAKVSYESFIRNAAQFFINRISQGLLDAAKIGSGAGLFSLDAVKVSQKTYEAWKFEHSSMMRNFAAQARFEEKALDPAELKTLVVMQGICYVKNDDPSLKILEKSIGDVTNL